MSGKNQVSKICCVGAGYVGGPTMSVIASKCPEIRIDIVDINEERISEWNSDQLPIYEPGLDQIVKESREGTFSSPLILKRQLSMLILFSYQLTHPQKRMVMVPIAADLKYVEAVARSIAENAKTPKIVVEKSTIPVRTAEAIRSVFDAYGQSLNHQVLSNPEFLAEGTALMIWKILIGF